MGYCEKDTDIKVKLRGGDLIVRYTDETVTLNGTAETVYTVEVVFFFTIDNYRLKKFVRPSLSPFTTFAIRSFASRPDVHP